MSTAARLTLSAHREGTFSEIALKNASLQDRVNDKLESATDATKSIIPMQFYRQTHNVPFKRELKPYISMAPAPRTYQSSGANFDIDYSETFVGPMALKFKISAGSINGDAIVEGAPATQGPYFSWSLPTGFACALLKQVTLAIHNEEIMKFDGGALYGTTMLDIDYRRLPALKNLWKEAHVEWKYVPGVPATTEDDGGVSTVYSGENASYSRKYSSFEARMSYVPLQVGKFYRPEFYIYVPLDVLPMNRSLYYAFPHIAVHDLKIQIRVEHRNVSELVNVYASDASLGSFDFTATTAEGVTTYAGDHTIALNGDNTVAEVAPVTGGLTVKGDYISPDAITWERKPEIVSKELYVIFYAVQSYLENALSLYRYTQIIPDISNDTFHLSGPAKQSITYAGNYSHIVMMPNYNHFLTRTYKTSAGKPTPLSTAADTVSIGDTTTDGSTAAVAGTSYAIQFPMDPFHEFVDVAPIDLFKVSPRSSEASVSYTWDELSLLQPYLMSLGDASCTPMNKNNMAIISYNTILDRERIMSFYPLGVAPNLEITIDKTIFTQDMPGTVNVYLFKFSEIIVWMNSIVKRFN